MTAFKLGKAFGLFCRGFIEVAKEHKEETVVATAVVAGAIASTTVETAGIALVPSASAVVLVGAIAVGSVFVFKVFNKHISKVINKIEETYFNVCMSISKLIHERKYHYEVEVVS